ncbi:MAG: hypothetical protein NTX03_07980, partial [Bacteroidetes bacterium]|nr:hypothetical protein [Bacteroidota bacterium]
MKNLLLIFLLVGLNGNAQNLKYVEWQQVTCNRHHKAIYYDDIWACRNGGYLLIYLQTSWPDYSISFERMNDLGEKKIVGGPYGLEDKGIITITTTFDTGYFVVYPEWSYDTVYLVFQKFSLNDSLELTQRNLPNKIDYPEVSSVVQSADSGFVLFGIDYQRNFMLSKLDKYGKKVWNKIIIDTTAFIFTYKILKANDGGYITSFTNRDEIWLYKISEKGDVIWKRDFSGSGYDRSLASFVNAPNANGYFMIGGGKLISLDNNANIRWSKTSDDLGTNFNSVDTTIDGNIILAGSVKHSSLDATIVKLNTSGEILWGKKFGGSGDDEFNTIKTTPKGGYIILGTTFSEDGDLEGTNKCGPYSRSGLDPAAAWLLKIKLEINSLEINQNEILFKS